MGYPQSVTEDYIQYVKIGLYTRRTLTMVALDTKSTYDPQSLSILRQGPALINTRIRFKHFPPQSQECCPRAQSLKVRTTMQTFSISTPHTISITIPQDHNIATCPFEITVQPVTRALEPLVYGLCRRYIALTFHISAETHMSDLLSGMKRVSITRCCTIDMSYFG